MLLSPLETYYILLSSIASYYSSQWNLNDTAENNTKLAKGEKGITKL
jgi:hypothetical protein